VKHAHLIVFCPAFAALLAAPLEAQRTRRPARPEVATWAPDGVHVVLGGAWYEPATWQKVEAQPGPAPAAAGRGPRAVPAAIREAFVNTLGDLPAAVLAGERTRSTLPRAPVAHPGIQVSADQKVAALVAGGKLVVWRDGEGVKTVAEGLAGVRHFEIAPDGRAVSYIDDFDLYVTRTRDGRTTRVTEDGGENFFNGELDWVYQEEVYGRFDFDATWWAPDGANLAFLRIDEGGVDTFTVVDHIPDQLELERLKYPKAGRTNPRATLSLVRESDGAKVAVDLGKYPASDEILIVRVGWTPQADKVVLLVQDREQTWLDLNFADPATGALTTVLRETCEDGWVERLPMPRWLEDGSFLWESDRTGYRHLYRYERGGKLLATVTHGEWQVTDVIRLEERANWIAFYGTTEDYAIGKNAYRATLDGKSIVRLTQGRGDHSIELNADGSMLLDSFSSLENPGEQWLRKADGTDVRKIHALEAAASAQKWEQIDARDGVKLDVLYTLPQGFDPTKKYPVWIETYSGPDSPSVRDSWRGGGVAPDWFVPLQVNVRSASGRGMKFTKTCYRQFGVQELRDIEDAVDWICKTHPWADPARVGISGWSYGGFMAAYALTHSDKFKCGIAGAGVYDWRLYDTIYTERYMATPQRNREGYDRSSCVKAAANLKGHLLIIHGTMDDNVHLQNAMQFVHALQNANQQEFTLMVYPKSRHGVGSRHLAVLRERFMRARL
jgi:dipeptidyl-peptidase-4